MWSWDFEVFPFMVDLANPSGYCKLTTLLVADGGIVTPTALPELRYCDKPLLVPEL